MVYRHGGAGGGLCNIRVRKVKTDFSGLFFQAQFIFKLCPFPLETTPRLIGETRNMQLNLANLRPPLGKIWAMPKLSQCKVCLFLRPLSRTYGEADGRTL